MDGRGNFLNSRDVQTGGKQNFNLQNSQNASSLPVNRNYNLFFIAGVIILVLIIVGAVFWLNSSPQTPVQEEISAGEEESIPEITAGGCDKLGLMTNLQKEYTCFDKENKLVKIYLSRSSENVILNRINFILYSSNSSANYSSDYGLAPGAFYNYQIPYSEGNLERVIITPIVQEDGGENECANIYINSVELCGVEAVIVEPEPEYYLDDNLNVIFSNGTNLTSNETQKNESTGFLSFFLNRPQKKILNFTVNSTVAEIDDVRHKIYLRFKENVSFSYLAPKIIVSPNATIRPLSGIGRDFTNPVVYTVTASDNSTQNYTVYVSIIEEIIEVPQTANETQEDINLSDYLNGSEEDSDVDYDCSDGSCDIDFDDWIEFNDTAAVNETPAIPSATIVNNVSGTVAGTWSTNLSAATQMAQMNKNFYIINYGNLQSCSICRATESDVFSKPEFKQWAYDNGIAMIYANSDYDTLDPTKTVYQRYVRPLLQSGVSIGYPFMIIVGYEGTTAVASFTYRKGYVINGIKAERTPAGFIKIVDSYTGKYRTNLTIPSASPGSNGSVSINISSISPTYNINWSLPSTKTTSGGVTESSIAKSGAVAGEWTKDLAAARNLAKQNNKFFIVNFGRTSGCAFCDQLDTAVYRYSEFKNWAKQNGIPLVYADYNNETSFYLIKRALLPSAPSMGFPTIAFVDEKDGKTVYGYRGLYYGGNYNWIDMSSIWSPIGFSLVTRSYVEGSSLRNYNSTRTFNTNNYSLDWNVDEVSTSSSGVVAKNSMYSLTNKPITVIRNGQNVNLTLRGNCSIFCAGSWTPNIIQAYNFSKTNNKFLLLYLDATTLTSRESLNSEIYGNGIVLNKLIMNQPSLMLWANKNNIPLAYGLLVNNSSSTYRLVSVAQQNQSSAELDFINSLYSSSENISFPTVILVDGQTKRVIAKFNYKEGQVYNGIVSYPNVKRFTEVIHSFVG